MTDESIKAIASLKEFIDERLERDFQKIDIRLGQLENKFESRLANQELATQALKNDIDDIKGIFLHGKRELELECKELDIRISQTHLNFDRSIIDMGKKVEREVFKVDNKLSDKILEVDSRSADIDKKYGNFMKEITSEMHSTQSIDRHISQGYQ